MELKIFNGRWYELRYNHNYVSGYNMWYWHDTGRMA
jgi:hypothetical protein